MIYVSILDDIRFNFGSIPVLDEKVGISVKAQAKSIHKDILCTSSKRYRSEVSILQFKNRSYQFQYIHHLKPWFGSEKCENLPRSTYPKRFIFLLSSIGTLAFGAFFKRLECLIFVIFFILATRNFPRYANDYSHI